MDKLIIYNKYSDLFYYSYMIIEKFETKGIGIDIKRCLVICGKNIITAHIDSNKRYNCLIDLEINLKLLKLLIRTCYKFKYININNYKAWSRKITDVSNLCGGWLKKCQRVVR